MYVDERERRLQKLVISTGYSRERVLAKLASGNLQVIDDGPAFAGYTRDEADQILGKAEGKIARGKPIGRKLRAKIEAIAKQFPEVGEVLGRETTGASQPVRKAVVDDGRVDGSRVRRDLTTGQLYVRGER
jgi:hypothetical protein